jgi:hypothetical protein
MSLENPWVQSIGGSLIAALIVGMVCFAVKRRREALFSIGVSTIIFIFGNILEPATKSVVEGPFTYASAFNDCVRFLLPGTFFFSLFVAGFIPGTITGLLILKARSFQQRVVYGAFWAVVSLTLLDAVFYYFALGGTNTLTSKLVTWSDVYFSLICDLFGGAIGGLIIGSLLHLFVTSTVKTPETATTLESIQPR